MLEIVVLMLLNILLTVVLTLLNALDTVVLIDSKLLGTLTEKEREQYRTGMSALVGKECRSWWSPYH